jgi:hypothetical protein
VRHRIRRLTILIALAAASPARAQAAQSVGVLRIVPLSPTSSHGETTYEITTPAGACRDGSAVRHNHEFTDGTKTVKEILVWETPS